MLIIDWTYICKVVPCLVVEWVTFYPASKEVTLRSTAVLRCLYYFVFTSKQRCAAIGTVSLKIT